MGYIIIGVVLIIVLLCVWAIYDPKIYIERSGGDKYFFLYYNKYLKEPPYEVRHFISFKIGYE